MLYDRPRFLAGGDKALVVEFGDFITPEVSQRVRRLHLALQQAEIPGFIEAIPTYRSLLVHYDPLRIKPGKLRHKLERLEQGAEEKEFPEPMVIELPVVYGGQFGPDMEFVASHNGLSAEEVVQVHSGTTYLVCMLGFMPGFAYLGWISPQISAPRLETPRVRVPAGSVGLAGNQTGVYPVESPGGWRLIGRTPVRLFDVHRQPPAVLKVGDYVTFVPVTPQEFGRIVEEVRRGVYKAKESRLLSEDKGGSF